MKKVRGFLAITAVLVMLLSSCFVGDEGTEPPKLTIRNQSSFHLSNVRFSDIPFIVEGTDGLPIGTSVEKEIAANDVGVEIYIFFTRRSNQNGDIACRTRAPIVVDSDFTFSFFNTTEVLEVANPSNTGNLESITRLEFDEDEDIQSQLVKKTKTETFNSNVIWSLPSDVTYPATVEIYALGAGGGGQGGNYYFDWGEKRGTGGAGGGGAAAYMELTIEEPTSFDIKIGRGGAGGDARDSSSGGVHGSEGESTRISWGTNTFTIPGGKGGGRSGTTGVLGGNGGVPTQGFPSCRGVDGSTGNRNTDINSSGGNAGSLFVNGVTFGGTGGAIRYSGGSPRNRAENGTNGGGGSGGYGGPPNNPGGRGGDGQVRIVVTWYE